MEYPKELIKAYRAHEISRPELVRRLTAMQGYSCDVKGHADKDGLYFFYRGRIARIEGNALVWTSSRGVTRSAQTVKEMKTLIDNEEPAA